jgi:acyl transferase domain-containing protein/acyl carrier protein
MEDQDKIPQASALKAELEPIAIVGIGCRFPGGANDPESYWNLMCAGVDTVSEIPPDRWDVDKFYDSDTSKPGTTHIRYGSFVKDIDRFDAQFFDISPREAAVMDPQQRMIMEVVWEAIENSGRPPEKLANTRTGVYLGVFAQDQLSSAFSELEREQLGPHSGIGASMSIVANRVSFWFDFKGPSLGLDTACSSSLVATHLGCQSLWLRETDSVIAGGVNAIFKPEWTIGVSRGGFLSVDGRCKSFDASANGYVRGEGAGAVLLKRLSDAVKDGDRIYALIRGTGSNQDGHTLGITLPNGESQKALMREVYQHAGVAPHLIQYVEAHGTGTVAGDPVEANSIGAILSEGRPVTDRCLMGSVKSNIGHLEAAAGVASLIKASLCLYHGRIPGNIHLKNLNPAIDLDQLKLKIPTQVVEFPGRPGERFAGVNSFGFGGTNAHAILADPAQAQSSKGKLHEAVSEPSNEVIIPPGNPPCLISFTARTPDALRDVVQSNLQFVTRNDPDLYAFGYNTNLRKGRHRHRLAIVAESDADLLEKMSAYLDGKPRAGMVSGVTLDASKGPVFVYSGMGPQWWAMGRELLEMDSVFRETVQECDALISQWADWSLWEELTATETESSIEETRIAQPAIFAVQVGLTAMWRSWGIEPAVIVGHSAGEVAAAWAAGALTLPDACRVIYERSRLQHLTEGEGRMMAVGLPATEVANVIRGFEDRVAIGAVNSPTSVTLAGDEATLEMIGERLDQKDVFRRMLYGKVPYHSPAMDRIKPELIASLKSLKPKTATTPLYSTVLGIRIDGSDLDASYWADNCRETVRFADVVGALVEEDYQLFLEVSAHPVLAGALKEGLSHKKREGSVVASLRRKEPELPTLLSNFGLIDALGFVVDWEKIYGLKAPFIELPKYPWQKERYWQNSDALIQHRKGTTSRIAMTGDEVHPLLGSRYDLAQPLWESVLDLSRLSYVADHKVQGNTLYPGAAYIEMALAAGKEILDSSNCALKKISFRAPLFIPSDASINVQLAFNPSSSSFEIYSRTNESDAKWNQHSGGIISQNDHAIPQKLRLDDITAHCSREVPKDRCYASFSGIGLEYGPEFQRLSTFRYALGQGLARIDGMDLPQMQDGDYQLHPTILDAAFQAFLATVLFGQDDTHARLFLPVGIDELSFFHEPKGEVWAYIACHEIDRSGKSLSGDIILADASGKVQVAVKGFRCQALDTSQDDSSKSFESHLYAYHWIPSEIAIQDNDSALSPARCLIFLDDEGVGDALKERLVQGGNEAVIFKSGDQFEILDEATVTIRPEHKGDLEKAWNHVSQDSGPFDKIVYLWSLIGNKSQSSNQSTMSEPVGCNDLLQLVQSIPVTSGQDEPTKLFIVTKSAQTVDENETGIAINQSPLWGFGRVLMNERPELSSRLIDLDDQSVDRASEDLLYEIFSKDDEQEIALRNGHRFVHRLEHQTLPSVNKLNSNTSPVSSGQSFAISNEKPPTDESIVWRSVERNAPKENEIEIEVKSAAFNASDIGLFETIIGCSGLISSVGEGVIGLKPGDEVVALVPQRLSRYAITDYRLATLKPSALSFDQVAAVVMPFTTAHYMLDTLARINKGETLLVCDAVDSIGVAVIQLLKDSGTKVLAVSGDEIGLQSLLEMGLPHVFNSNDYNFSSDIREHTQGRGVDVVINSLGGISLPDCTPVLSNYVRFIETESSEMSNGEYPENSCLFKVDMARLISDRPELVGGIMQDVMNRFEDGNLIPIPCDPVSASNIHSALELKKKKSKWATTVVQLDDPDLRIATSLSQPEVFHTEGTWLITGGLSGFGFATAQWLVAQGIQSLVLISRSGKPDSAAETGLSVMKNAGVLIRIMQADVTNDKQVQAVFDEIRTSDQAPLKGIVHSANLYADAPIAEMDRDRFHRVVAPKMAGAWNLHCSSLHDDIDFFILYSSITSLVGNPGQVNYSAANAYLDAFASYRRGLDLPALTVNWGALADVGFLAANQQVDEHLKRIGITAITPVLALSMLPHLLNSGVSNSAVADVNWSTWAAFHDTGLSSRFSSLVAKPGEEQSKGIPVFVETLQNIPQIIDRTVELESQMLSLVASVLGLNPSNYIDLTRGLTDMGMDSMLAMELRQKLQDSYGCTLQTTTMFKYPSIAKLLGYFRDEVLAELFCEDNIGAESPEDDLDDLSEDQLAELLAEELTDLRNPKS